MFGWVWTSSRRASSTGSGSVRSRTTGGGLSGCTYQEGISWGKFVPPEEGGRFAEVLSDATVVWPLLMVGLLERLRHKPAKS